MKIQKVSPIAQYLSENKAITKRKGDMCYFYNKNGLLLGTQKKITDFGVNAYIREIFGEGLKKLYFECVVLGQECTYFKNDKSPIGLGLFPVKTLKHEELIDFLSNKVTKKETEINLVSNKDLLAVDENTGTGIFSIHKPYLFQQKCIENEEYELDKSYQIKHSIN